MTTLAVGHPRIANAVTELKSSLRTFCNYDLFTSFLCTLNYSSILNMSRRDYKTIIPDEDLKEFVPVKRGSRYVCPWNEFRRPSILDTLHWKFCIKDNSNIPPAEVLDRILPVKKVQRSDLESPPLEKIQITWIGHATVLVQFDGISVLTDPLFGDFSGPEIARYLPFLAYWRYRKAACSVSDIPKLDAVVISHNHYDHLDVGSVREINQKFPEVQWFVPEGSAEWFRSVDCQNITELSWWQEGSLIVDGNVFKFISAPAQHWCQRGIFDLNKCLWCSWVIQGPSKKSFYFGGDTGYYECLFKKIGEKYGPFSLAALPIGAYEPRHITSYQHVDPDEAVRIHEDIRSEVSVGIHWGTFSLTNEYYLEPPNAVEELMEYRKLDTNKFFSLSHGETWVVGEHRECSPFMKTRKVSDD